MMDIGAGWIRSYRDVEEVARFCQPALRVSELVHQSWDPVNVHLLVTAKEFTRDRSPVDRPGIAVTCNAS